MRKFLLFISILLSTMIIYGQTPIVDENVDLYTAGTYFVQQAGTPWTTWSNAPGTSEDPMVSTNQASSTPNSVYIQTNNDLVLELSDYTTGRYAISFNIFVESGKLGYFNILNDFAGSNSVWAMQAYLKTNGYMVIDAGAASADSIAYTQNEWHQVLIIVDLDDDIATIEFDGQFMHMWKFSSGSFGDGTMKKLDAVNFFGWSEGSLQGGYYIDDILVEQVTAPDAPSSLTATLQNQFDVHLIWDAPSTTPTKYFLMRNNQFIAEVDATATSYTDIHVYPQTLTYKLFNYVASQGVSAPDSVNITIPGGVDRNLVLFEIATATDCPYCPSAARGVNGLMTNNAQVAVINYHAGDSYASTDGNTRLGYYIGSGSLGTPTTWVDGVYSLVGGVAGTGSLYTSYNNVYQMRKVVPSALINYLSINKINDSQFEATVSVKEALSYFTSDLKLFVALTESNIAQSWFEMTELDYVCRKMYPNGNGTALDFSLNDSLTFTFTIDIPTGVEVNNCEVVAFVQHTSSKEVVQTAKAPLVGVGIDQYANNQITIYPSPASDFITISNALGMHMQIVNLNGQLVKDQLISSSNCPVYVNDLPTGIYLVTFAENPSWKYKIVIMH